MNVIHQFIHQFIDRGMALGMGVASSLLIAVGGDVLGAEGILANEGTFKPKISFGEIYKERLVTTSEPSGEAGEPPTITREVVANPTVTMISLTANLAGLDPTEISSSTPISVRIGGFEFSSTLGDATVFSPKQSKAIYSFTFIETIDLPSGDSKDLVRKAGSITVSWAKSLLKVAVALNNLEEAGFGNILTSDYVGMQGDNGKPFTFVRRPLSADVTFGSLSGSRPVFASGTSKVAVRKFGSVAAGTDEEIGLNSVSVSGAADVLPPAIAATVPAASSGGMLTFNGSVTDISQTVADLDAVALSFQVNGENRDPSSLDLGEANSKGASTFTVGGLALAPSPRSGFNVVTVVATDSSGNVSRLTKKIKTGSPAKKSGPMLIVLPDSTTTDLALAAINSRSKATVAMLTRDEQVFGSRFVRGIRELDFSTSLGTCVLRFDDEGVPYELEVPDGSVVSFDTSSPDLDPTFPGETLRTATARRVSPRDAGDSIRDKFRLLRPGDYYDKQDLAALNQPLADLLDEAFDLVNQHVENVISIGAARNPALAALNALAEFRDTVADHMDSIGNAVQVSKSVLDGVSSLDFDTPGWFDSVKSTIQSGFKDFSSGARQTYLESSPKPPNSGFWTATVWWARDPSVSDSVWQQTVARIGPQIQATLDPKIITLSFRNSGFVLTWKRIPTSDFASVKAYLSTTYGASPWTLQGPYLSK